MSTLHSPHSLQAVQVAVARTTVDVVGADRHAHEFLEEVQFLVGTAAGDQPAETISAVGCFDRIGSFGDEFQRFLPCGSHERPDE